MRDTLIARRCTAVSTAFFCCLLACLLSPSGMLSAAAAPLPPYTARARGVLKGLCQLQLSPLGGPKDDGSYELVALDPKFRLISPDAGYVGQPSIVVARVYPSAEKARQVGADPTAAEDDPDKYNPGEPFDLTLSRPAPPDQQALLLTYKPTVAAVQNGNKIFEYALGGALGLFRWNNVLVGVYFLQISTHGFDAAAYENPADTPEARQQQAAIQQQVEKETREFNDRWKGPTIQLCQTLYQALDVHPAGQHFVTGQGTQNAIDWGPLDETKVRVPEAEIPLTVQPITGLPLVDTGGGEGFAANWSLSPTDGLLVGQAQYLQGHFFSGEKPLQRPGFHDLADSLQWRNCRILFPGESQPRLIPLNQADCTDLYRIASPGTGADGKAFAWAVVARFLPDCVSGPPGSDVKYLLDVTEEFLFSTPAADQEPSGKALVVKVYPTLTVWIAAVMGQSAAPLTFAADLKMLFAPRLTREDEHRPEAQYLPASRWGTNVVTTVCDTNDELRPVPGQFRLGPNPPYWDWVFDYVQPEIQKERAFDAVTWPRSDTDTRPFTVDWPGANYHYTGAVPDPLLPGLKKGQLRMRRMPGQGEFDNLHIHPYVGFDDPSDAGATHDQSRALIEAPLAADEVIHMHWRWGVQVPTGATGVDPADFRGYSDDNRPHQTDGAPLIPANQSLRIKVGLPRDDSAADPVPGQERPLDPLETAVWYEATIHGLQPGAPAQLFAHGYGLAYHLDPLGPVSNTDLLGAPIVVPGYHNFRWTNVPLTTNVQRVPAASDIPGLSRNRLSKNDPGHNKDRLP